MQPSWFAFSAAMATLMSQSPQSRAAQLVWHFCLHGNNDEHAGFHIEEVDFELVAFSFGATCWHVVWFQDDARISLTW